MIILPPSSSPLYILLHPLSTPPLYINTQYITLFLFPLYIVTSCLLLPISLHQKFVLMCLMKIMFLYIINLNSKMAVNQLMLPYVVSLHLLTLCVRPSVNHLFVITTDVLSLYLYFLWIIYVRPSVNQSFVTAIVRQFFATKTEESPSVKHPSIHNIEITSVGLFYRVFTGK